MKKQLVGSAWLPASAQTGEAALLLDVMDPVIKILRLRPEEDADIPLPRYMTPDAAGMDLCAAVRQDMVLEQGKSDCCPPACHGRSQGYKPKSGRGAGWQSITASG